jgi:hypothetical protein
LEQICGGSRSPSLIHIHIYHSIQTPQGANISRGKWEGQIIFLGVNIYPYHPNSAMVPFKNVRSQISLTLTKFIENTATSITSNWFQQINLDNAIIYNLVRVKNVRLRPKLIRHPCDIGSYFFWVLTFGYFNFVSLCMNTNSTSCRNHVMFGSFNFVNLCKKTNSTSN